MRNFICFRLTVAITLTFATMVSAQFGPPPGLGGPGEMPVCGLMLVTVPEVRQELGLVESQLAGINNLQGGMQEQLREVFENMNFPEVFNLGEEERDKKFESMRTRIQSLVKTFDQKLEEFLKPEQATRLQQLVLQRDVIGGLKRPEISRQLELTETQNVRLDELTQNKPRPFEAPDIKRQSHIEALALLNEVQKRKWEDLKGKAFTFPEHPRFGGPGGLGGPGGPMGPPMEGERKIVAQFDEDHDGRLNPTERAAARKFLQANRGPGGPGGPGGRRPIGLGGFLGGPPGPPGGPPRGSQPGKPGPKISPADVQPVGNAQLYEPTVLRTVFLVFENGDWEQELEDFSRTDVEIPATVIVDGKTYPNVGVQFRGMSSLMGVQAGSKRSMNLSFDFVDPDQRLLGYKTINLLNSHEDPTFLHTVLYSEIARKYLPAPKANFVKLAVNGESWGIYINAQQFNKDFLGENYSSTKGARWKVQGSPMGRGGLEYLGEQTENYRARYSLKTADREKDWKRLIKLCKTLNETPLENLEVALTPMLDLDETLWFLALDNALINSDGYWIRASDYAIYCDEKGVFHMIPHDMNEAFQPPMGPGMGGPGGRPGWHGDTGPGPGRPGHGGPSGLPPAMGVGPGPGPGRPAGPGVGRVDLDPLVGLSDVTKPLRSRLLAVPQLRKKYLEHIRTLAQDALDWNQLQPIVTQYHQLISVEVEADTRKLSSFTEFQQTVLGAGKPGARSQSHMSLKEFAEQRREFLLKHPAIESLPSAEVPQ